MQRHIRRMACDDIGRGMEQCSHRSSNEHQGLAAAGKECTQSLRGSMTLLTPLFPTSHLQNCEEVPPI